MARYSGKVGYGTQVKKAPGVWDDQITEFTYFGDVIRNVRNLREGDSVNGDLSVNNSISIVADPYARENFLSIKYVMWLGVAWTVTEVESRPPRLILTLGSVYNGPTGTTPDTP